MKKSALALLWAVMAVACLSFSTGLFAQASPQTVILEDCEPEPAKYSPPKVTQITLLYNGPDQKQNAREGKMKFAIFPGGTIKFTIANPLDFLNSRPSDKSKVVLYVNGMEMKGITSEWMTNITKLQINSGQVPPLGDKADIYLTLIRSDSTQAAWRYFYGNTDHFYDRYVQLNASLGWEGMSELPVPQDMPKITIVFYRLLGFYIWLGLFVIVIGGFLAIGIWTDALRDGGRYGAYSLSLTQLLFWTALVIGAFIYCTVLTDIITSFNNSILLLLGISVSTTGIAYYIDTRFARANQNAPQKQNNGFIQDILSDGKGYSVQRIQIFAWNLVLGTYFILYTLSNKTMPEFSETLLFLAGVSSASYLAAKGPENANSQVPVAAAGTVQSDTQTINSPEQT